MTIRPDDPTTLRRMLDARFEMFERQLRERRASLGRMDVATLKRTDILVTDTWAMWEGLKEERRLALTTIVRTLDAGGDGDAVRYQFSLACGMWRLGAHHLDLARFVSAHGALCLPEDADEYAVDLAFRIVARGWRRDGGKALLGRLFVALGYSPGKDLAREIRKVQLPKSARAGG